jgi:hypothetical protein
MASTQTSRLKLFKPTAGSNEPFRASDFNGNMDAIDAQIGAWVCTSTTRPSAPFIGQTIFETDTGYFRSWSGTFWLMVGGNIPTHAVTLPAMSGLVLAGWRRLDTAADATSIWDPSNEFFSHSLATDTVTLKRSGVYTVTANFASSAEAAGRILNGSTAIALDKIVSPLGAVTLNATRRLAGNTAVASEIYIYSGTGATLLGDMHITRVGD